MMPRDVATRWNSTFEMLTFALEHKGALRIILTDIDLPLTKYQLSVEEWAHVKELAAVLEVQSNMIITPFYSLT